MRPLLLGLLLCFATSAHAFPSVRMSWDDCTVITPNKSWSGPGTYRLVISGTGFTEHYRFVQLTIGFYPRRVVRAWDFSTFDYWNGGTGCQGPTRLSIGAGSASCPSYPAASVTGSMQEGSLTQPGGTWIDLQSNLDPSFTPDGAQRYALFRIDFDHSQSLEGIQPYPACGQVEEPMCLVVVGKYLNTTTVTNALWADEVAYATWQDPTNSTRCPGATPAAAKTWGGVKAQYR